MKSIPNFPDYQITRNGQVWSKPRISQQKHELKGQWLKPIVHNTGYKIVNLFINSQRHTCNIHRLVLETYVGPCPDGMECRHLNGIRTDNRLENLCWGTHSENVLDAVKHGTHVNHRGESSPNSKITERDARMIIYMYHTKEFLQREIAKIYNIDQGLISRIINRKSWKHLYAKI